MASGTAFRCKIPNERVLSSQDLNPNHAKKSKAPRKMATEVNLMPALLFDLLPIEVLHMILMNLDILSIKNFRRANKTGRLVVESLSAYSLLRTHASTTLRIIDTVKYSQHCPIGQLFAEFCHPWCRTCGDFGPFLYLLRLRRSCYKCNFFGEEYAVARTTDLRLYYGLPRQQLLPLPMIHSLKPGKYCIADVVQAKASGMRLHGSEENMKRILEDTMKRRKVELDARLGRWGREGYGQKPRPASTVGIYYIENGGNQDLRMQATVTFPYWDPKTQRLEPGVYCRACTYRSEEVLMDTLYSYKDTPSQTAYHRAFLERDIPEHFRTCSAVKEEYEFQDLDPYRELNFKRDGVDFVVEPKESTDI
ncbi:hypothetical protein P170DRAFT_425190 [Aspergillus steynii IBT 23096]|uniref:F-box domain-containing protein n=1 Tax=Aspergillus steynii IBT 23096 TaxID=1392250 RepID=A0A2I2GDE5_9EURO|nr:uncharacterized protein P170DRAFT_425190 [Aspergillus steynii IBT 23096]PLB50893.1 hypothetical protein P170DRAFT_425190 [Aspergillus steynii IBT 23096]